MVAFEEPVRIIFWACCFELELLLAREVENTHSQFLSPSLTQTQTWPIFSGGQGFRLPPGGSAATAADSA